MSTSRKREQTKQLVETKTHFSNMVRENAYILAETSSTYFSMPNSGISPRRRTLSNACRSAALEGVMKMQISFNLNFVRFR